MSNYYHIKKHCRKGTAVQPDMHLTNANNDSDWLQRRVNRRFQLHHKLRCKLQHKFQLLVTLSDCRCFVCLFVFYLFAFLSTRLSSSFLFKPTFQSSPVSSTCHHRQAACFCFMHNFVQAHHIQNPSYCKSQTPKQRQ